MRDMIRTLLMVLAFLAVAGLIWFLGSLLLAAVHAPAIFATIWLAVLVIVVLVLLLRFLKVW